MGFADALFKLGVPYNSDEGTNWGERFMKFSTTKRTPAASNWPAAGLLPELERQHLDTRHHRHDAQCRD
jgi:hypothetical protein